MQIFEFIKKTPVLSSTIFKNPTRMVGFFKKISESKNCWFWLFHNPQRTGSSHEITSEELVVL